LWVGVFGGGGGWVGRPHIVLGLIVEVAS